MTQIKNNFLESIGNTPLIKLKAASEITGCHIFGKAEYLNPGGSVKDRAALALIKDAQEKKDTLRNIGADLRLVTPKPYKDDGNYVKVAGRLAEELKSTNNNGVVWANQFDNTANAKGQDRKSVV